MLLSVRFAEEKQEHKEGFFLPIILICWFVLQVNVTSEYNATYMYEKYKDYNCSQEYDPSRFSSPVKEFWEWVTML